MEECIICFEEYNNFVIFPCNHKVCVVCYPKLNRCPLCNQELEMAVRIAYDQYILMIFFYIVLFVLLLCAIRFY